MAREDDMLNSRVFAHGDDIFFIVGIGVETRRFCNNDEVAVLGSWINHGNVMISLLLAI